MARIAFIGLGNMGGGMAANLVRKGHQVRAFDLGEEALARAVSAGCTHSGTAADAVADAEIVVSMLPNGAIVEQLYREQVMGRAPQQALFIDCSTIDVATARMVIAQAAEAGYEMVDAPSPAGLRPQTGHAHFHGGGTAEAFARAEPVLAHMGKAVIHAGIAGSGQAAKICNNMILGATMIATCEAFALADRLGLDLQTFYDIASRASGQSWSMTSYCPVPGVKPESPADHGYAGGFAAALMLKDLRLALGAAQDAGAHVPMGIRAEALYADFVEQGGGQTDFSGIIEAL